MRIIPYGRQHITEEDIAAVVEVLRGDFLTQGPAIARFEEEFAKIVGAKFAVAVANGTGALHIAALALGVKPGTRVLTTPITFSASSNCIRYCGGEVEFVDIDPRTRCIDVNLVEKKLRGSPKGTYQGIVPVDFAGQPVDLERLKKLADEFGLWILEDACHALGGEFQDTKGVWQKTGNCAYADAAIFSFHPVKHITTGEGGLITTNSEALYKTLCTLRTHGITKNPAELNENHGGWYYEMQILGYNYRLTDFQAALGSSQLKRLAEGNKRREAIVARYKWAFSDLPITLPQPDPSLRHGWHLYVIETDRRKELYDFLRANNVMPQVHYVPVNSMPYYRELGFKPEDTPHAKRYYERCLSLPLYPSMTDQDVEVVIELIRDFYNG